MAKDKDLELDDNLDEEEGQKKGKPMTAIIAILIVLIWLVIFALLIKLDVGGFGSTVMYPVLKDVPLLNMILPAGVSEEIVSNKGDAYTSLRQAVDRINELEAQLAIYEANANDNAITISTLRAEVERLKNYEENQKKFEQLKKKFDLEVVYTDNAPDIDKYKEWYEEIEPERAEEIYRQVVEQMQLDAVIQDLAKTYSSMKPASAARIFEEMTGDMEKLARILRCMKTSEAAAILEAMDKTLAAKLTLLIYPVME